MVSIGKPRPVTEREAEGEIAQMYHEIKQTLRVSGINLNFRTWAGYRSFLPLLWHAVRPNVETRAFEDAADHVRAEAVQIAQRLGRVGASAHVRLGPSQAYQIQAALRLYHYINPKLLVLTSAVRLALAGEPVGGNEGGVNERTVRLARGVPAHMYPMEMVSERPEDERIRAVFADITQTLSLSTINSDYRTLALWPDYLIAAWERVKPIVGEERYTQAATELRETARSLARGLPYPIPLSRERVEEGGEDVDAILQTTEQFEQLLPSLLLNIALFALDWQLAEALRRSLFPAASFHVQSEPGEVP